MHLPTNVIKWRCSWWIFQQRGSRGLSVARRQLHKETIEAASAKSIPVLRVWASRPPKALPQVCRGVTTLPRRGLGEVLLHPPLPAGKDLQDNSGLRMALRISPRDPLLRAQPGLGQEGPAVAACSLRVPFGASPLCWFSL